MSLHIEIINTTSSDKVYATVTGLALDPPHQNARFLLRSDGKTPYFPASPAHVQTPITDANVGIPLGAPGKSVTITIPHIAGGRIYFSLGQPLKFLLNPGPALAEPSVTNPSDANYGVDWAFAEFTFNADQVYANVSYVDFVPGLPVSLELECGNGQKKVVKGMQKDGADRVAKGLEDQGKKDGQAWGKLAVRGKDGKLLRVLSPNQGMVMDPKLLSGYFEGYVGDVWKKFAAADIHVDSQAAFGVLKGRSINANELRIDDQVFTRPSTHDIFNASSGPFATGANAKRNAIIPRLNAELNRSTMLTGDSFPASHDKYYQNGVTNHYARLVHACNIDGRGYAHPYDDVAPSGGPDQSGFVNDGHPKLLRITVGGPR